MVESTKDQERFTPTEAVAFFLFMIVFYAGFWVAMYALMAQRG